MIWLIVLLILYIIIAFALLVDRINKEIIDNNQNPIHPNAKPGESSTHRMGEIDIQNNKKKKMKITHLSNLHFYIC